MQQSDDPFLLLTKLALPPLRAGLVLALIPRGDYAKALKALLHAH